MGLTVTRRISFRMENVEGRTYAKEGLSASVKKELHIFCDRSEQVIAAVAYLRTVTKSGVTEVKFVIGKAKVSPIHSHTIPGSNCVRLF